VRWIALVMHYRQVLAESSSSPMSHETLPDHLRRPHLRPIQPLPVQKDGQQFIALRDPTMLTMRTMVVQPQVVQVVQMFRGQHTVEEIAKHVGAPLEQFMQLVRTLDEVGLLWGPTFEQMEEQRKTELKQRGYFEPHAAAAMGEDEAACRKAMEQWFDQTDDPELDGDLTGIVAPHLDYERGWPNYAAAYYGVRQIDAPDRVVILGTNHFGLGDGAILSEYGFATPLGVCPPDQGIVGGMVERLGRPLIIDQLDHLAEHSVQLQLPWLQYCFGNEIPIVAALVPDPLQPMLEDDGERINFDQFVSALDETIKDVGGRTFFVASSDLSHVGPQFGEPRPVDERRRTDVEQHDRDMMSKFIAGDPDEFLAAMEWSKNPTRWCSVGNMAATLKIARPQTIELIDYRQAFDDNGMVLVSSSAMAMY
jgi:MEMO1 family protein